MGSQKQAPGVSRLEGLVTAVTPFHPKLRVIGLQLGPFMERLVQLALVILRAVPEIALSAKATPSSKFWP